MQVPSTQPAPHSTWLRRLAWPDLQRRKRMLRVEAWIVVFASYALLAFAYLLPPDYRNDSPAYVLAFWLAMMVRTFQFHIGLLLLAIALVAAFGRGRRLFVAAIPLALLILVRALGQFVPHRPSAAAGGPTFRVMSVNLLMVNQQKEALADEMLAANPDILLLQEYTDEWHATLQRKLLAQYPHHAERAQDDSFGMAIYSRLPFNGEPETWLHLGQAVTPQMRTVIKVQRQDVAFYNVHLLPPRGPAYVSEHRLQFADLLKELAAEKLPYVLAGDFNFPPTTVQHRDLMRIGARETHTEAGRGMGLTWPVNSVFRYLPGMRIDHLYIAPSLSATRHETGYGAGSDHRPVWADIALQ